MQPGPDALCRGLPAGSFQDGAVCQANEAVAVSLEVVWLKLCVDAGVLAPDLQAEFVGVAELGVQFFNEPVKVLRNGGIHWISWGGGC